MRNHHEKPRDMARSALASNHRRAARVQTATVHRAHRRGVHQQLWMLRRAVDPLDVEDDLRVDDHRQIGEVAGWRKAFDSLGPLMNWSEAHLRRHVPDAGPWEQVQYFTDLLPDTVAGRHARNHIAGWHICGIVLAWPDECPHAWRDPRADG